MARKLDKYTAIVMRKKGMSYSQIKEKIDVSKGTLSGWLKNLPLSEERIKELRGNNLIRIERFRNTMKRKRELRFSNAYKEMAQRIGKISSREIFLTGLFLYWAEGTKTKNTAICLTNTNSNMLKFYIHWLNLLQIKSHQLKVHLHLYSDMDIKKEEQYWSKELSVPLLQFRKSYIKDTKLSSVKYHNGFGHGTCSIIVEGARLYEKVLMGIKYIEDNL